MDVQLSKLLVALWPVIVLQFAIMVWALVDLLRRKSVKGLPKIGWGAIIVAVSFFGPIAYLAFGRGEE